MEAPGRRLARLRLGGINVFRGGLALYGAGKKIVGGVGVSGDTSCADHNIAWRVRNNLGLDHLSGVGGVSGDPARPDNIIFDIAPNPYGGTGISAGGFGHPTCLNTSGSNTLPPVHQLCSLPSDPAMCPNLTADRHRRALCPRGCLPADRKGCHRAVPRNTGSRSTAKGR